jgi:deoxyribonuclease-4
LVKTAAEAQKLGLEALQIFVRNPRGAAARELGAEEVNLFRSEITAANIDPVVVHIPYISNPASVKSDLYALAGRIISEDLVRCDLIGARFLVLHPGSSTGSTSQESLIRLAKLLEKVLNDYQGEAQILLETMSGQGSEIGRSFDELKMVFDNCSQAHRLGICFDTCHTFAAGYELKTVSGLDMTAEEITRLLGKEAIKVVHVNDSLSSLGSHRDRHAPIGKGELGVETIRQILRHPLFNNTPFILETPFETMAEDVEIVKSLRN